MAYTKYSLTPANNNATPPDGAPEGMLPSAVNDTMRDMMAQIRDVGDGIRNGTYTMTAPVITGGSITGTTLTGNTFSNPVITGVSTFSAGTVSAPSITTTGDTNTGIFFPAADTIAFAEGGVESMRIDSSGNVGIGTSSGMGFANYQVVGIGGGSSAGGIIQFQTTAGTDSAHIRADRSGATLNSFVVETRTSAPLVFGTNGTERMRIDSSGNVGIGTSSPSARLHAVSSSAEVARFIRDNTNNASGGVTIGNNTRVWTLYGDASSLAFYDTTANAERMRIDSSGRVLVGTTTTINTSYKLQVDNGAAGSIVANSTGGGDANFYSTSTGIGYHIYAESTTAKFYVVNAGTIYSTNTAVQAISDIRHKENIKDLETGLAEVLALKPRRFDWKEGCGTGEKNVAGFIAQEVEPILPDLIGDWQNQMGSDEKFKSLAMGNMLPTLVKAIQEQQAMIEELKQEVALLKSK